MPLFCLFWPGREAEVCNSIRGKVAKEVRRGHNSGRESMTSQPSWPPLRGALKDSSANLMILQRPGLQSAARRRFSRHGPSPISSSCSGLGRNVSEEVTVKVLHFSFHSPHPLFPTCRSNDRAR